MRLLLLYFLSFVLLDALVPRSCSKGPRPWERPAELYCEEDSLATLRLTYGPQDADSGFWSISATPDSMMLCYRVGADSLVYQLVEPCDSATFDTLMSSVNGLDMIYDFASLGPSECLHGDDRMELYYDSKHYNWEFAQCRTSDTTYVGIDVDGRVLRSLFISLFPTHFDDNDHFVR